MYNVSMDDKEGNVKYQIVSKDGVHTLYSIVKTNFGGDAKNFIAESGGIEDVEFIAAKLGVMPKDIEYVG